jgi:hypothetical protein
LLGEGDMLKSPSGQQSKNATDTKSLASNRNKPDVVSHLTTSAAGARVDIMMRVRNPDGSETIMWVEAKTLEEILKARAVTAAMYGS